MAQAAAPSTKEPSSSDVAGTMLAAQAGDANAQADLGLYYLLGTGVPQDITKARIWLKKAAAQGSVQATRALSSLRDSSVREPGQAAPVSPNPLAVASSAPTDEEIVELSRNRFRELTVAGLQARYGRLEKLGSDDVLEVIQGASPYTARAALACTVNAPAEKQRCLRSLRDELTKERDKLIDATLAPEFSEKFIFTVQSKTNYEGNYVAYVIGRRRGTDQSWQWKLLLRFQGGRWVIADLTEKEVN